MRSEVERIVGIRRFALSTVLLFSVTTAAAQPAAEAAFERGREMLKVGKYTEACAAFEESQQLQPSLDTQFNIALCSEQLGKLATALAIHRTLAETHDTEARRARSAALAAQLEPRVPRVQIEVGEARKRTRRPPPGLVVKLNDVLVSNLDDVPIDLGTNSVTATAPGFLDWSGEVSAAQEAKRVTIAIDFQRDPRAKPGVGPAAPDLPPDEDPTDQPATSNRKAYASITLVFGTLALGGGAMFGILASTAWTDAQIACGDDTSCNETQIPIFERFRDKAETRGNISTVMFIAGGVAAVAGLYLYVTAPSENKSVAVAPSVDTSSTGVVVFGRF